MTMWLALLVAASAPVVDATHERAYFAIGRAQGLVVGATVSFGATSCVIDQLARQHASCPITGARRGTLGQFEPVRVARAAPTVSSTIGPGLVADGSTLTADFARSPGALPFVEAVETETPLRAAGVAARAFGGVEVWAYGGRDPFLRERVDLAVSGLELGVLGLTGDLSLTAIAWNVRPPGTRFRPQGGAQLYVHTLAVKAREPGRAVTAAAGRIRPYAAPGLWALDGVQVGYRPWLDDVEHGVFDDLEIGVLAGAPPSLSTLEPQTERWLAGAYWRWSGALGRFALHNEGRAGFARGAHDFGELESAVYLSDRRLDVSAAARATVDGDGLELPGARLFVASHLLDDTLHLSAAAISHSASDDLFDGAASLLEASDHLSGAARYTGLGRVELAVTGGAARAVRGSIARGYAGPEVSLDGVLGGVATVAYQEAFGTWPGRAAHLQWLGAPLSGSWLFTRLSWIEDRWPGGAEHDLALQAVFELPLVLGLSFESSARVVYSLIGPGSLGVVARVGVGGAL